MYFHRHTEKCSLFVQTRLDLSPRRPPLRECVSFPRSRPSRVERGRRPPSGRSVAPGPSPPVRRKGELGRTTISPQWPHHRCCQPSAARTTTTVRPTAFAKAKDCRSARTQSFRHDARDMRVFSFAEHTHAEQFCHRFGAHMLDTKDRPKWPGASSYHHEPRQPPCA